MSNNPQIYHGEWWVPAKAEPSNSMFMTMPEGFEKKPVKWFGIVKDE